MADQYNFSDVMISYSRKDVDFVRHLDAEFRKHGDDVWVDWEDIAATEDWWKAIEAGIEAANTFVFVISPDSLTSGVCRRELGHALKHNKRIVPILYREVDDAAQGSMHPTLRRHNWIHFTNPDAFKQSFQKLRSALNTDLRHVREHTRLLVRANEWDQKERPNSLLLRGDDLQKSQVWLLRSVTLDPEPTPLQIEYIEVSVQTADRQRRNFAVGGVMVMALIGAALIFGIIQQSVAQRAVARQAEAAAQALNADATAQAANEQATAAFADVQFAETELALLEESSDSQQSAIDTQVAMVQTLNAVADEAANEAATRSAQMGTAFVQVTQAQSQIGNAQTREAIANQQLAVQQAQVASVLQTVTALAPTVDAIATFEQSVPITATWNAEFFSIVQTEIGNVILLQDRLAELQSDNCSRDSLVETEVRFANTGRYDMGVYWVDYECNERLYAILGPGEAYLQGTFRTHPWVVRNCATGEETRYTASETVSQVSAPVANPNFNPTTDYCTFQPDVPDEADMVADSNDANQTTNTFDEANDTSAGSTNTTTIDTDATDDDDEDDSDNSEATEEAVSAPSADEPEATENLGQGGGATGQSEMPTATPTMTPLPTLTPLPPPTDTPTALPVSDDTEADERND